MEKQRPWYLSESFFLALIILLPPVAFIYLLVIRKKADVTLELFMAGAMAILWLLKWIAPLTQTQLYIGIAIIVLAPFTFAIITNSKRE